MVRDTRPDRLDYKGLSADVEQPGWYCSCGEIILSEADVAVTDGAYLDLRAKADGLLTAADVARIRRKLKLSQRRAGELLGGGPRAFQKYETQAVAVSKPMSNLLRLLERHPEVLNELSADGSARNSA
jgi:HTH-type transcriptional regulator/antitoxin MqsA